VKVTHLSATYKGLVPAVQSPGVEFDIRPDLEKGVVLVEGRGRVHELQAEPKREEASIGLEVVYRTCKVCSLKRGGYHEAIVQIRGETDKRELSNLVERLESLATEEAREFVTDVKAVRGGVDVYIGSLALGRKMAAFLKKSGATISESSKLVGQSKNGKRKYRVTILARFPENTSKRGRLD
jgi:NMD protein affecting ribosome stability and mRNA decay